MILPSRSQPYCPDHNYAGAQCEPLRVNLARYFLHDSMRALDYLCSRPEIDPNRIGVTGRLRRRHTILPDDGSGPASRCRGSRYIHYES